MTETISACPTREEVVRVVCQVIEEQLALPSGSVKTDDKFGQDIPMDSLDRVEIQMKVEEAFDIELTERGSDDVTTPGELGAAVLEALPSRGH